MKVKVVRILGPESGYQVITAEDKNPDQSPQFKVPEEIIIPSLSSSKPRMTSTPQASAEQK